MASELIPVRVAVRCRPLVKKEISEGCRTKVEFFEEYQQISLPGLDKAFTFDFIFTPNATQDEVYDKCTPNLLNALFNGYNATILAYGQTGSGKTFTMGTAYNSEGSGNPVGIIPRVIEDLFHKLEENNCFYTMTVSFLEVYNEDIYDLFSKSRECMSVREDRNGIQVAGMQELVVKSKDDVLKHLAKGSNNRQTGATNMNQVSSRSHALFTITVKLSNNTNTTTSKFHLVDLAGSEKAKKTGAQGERFKEGVNINKGLFALGNVISALCDKSPHIPYRDSRLTRLLQDSLGGNSHTVMIACISPADSNLEETVNTLRYADRARKIKNRPIINFNQEQKELEEWKHKYSVLETTWNEHMEICPTRNVSEKSVQPPEVKEESVSPKTEVSVKENTVCINEEQNKVTTSLPKNTSEPARVKQKTAFSTSSVTSLSETNSDSDSPMISSHLSRKRTSDSQSKQEVLYTYNSEFPEDSPESPKKEDLEFELDELRKTNLNLLSNWTESLHASAAYEKKHDQMQMIINGWKDCFEDLTAELRSEEKKGKAMLPTETWRKLSKLLVDIADADSVPETNAVLEVNHNPLALLEIQQCLRELEDNLCEKQAELAKQKSMTEDLQPLQKIAENQRDQIQQLEKEKAELEDYLHKNPSAKISEDRRKKIHQLEKQVSLLRKQLELNQRTLKNKDLVEKKMKALSTEILMLKRTKVGMQKEHEQIKRQFRAEKLKAAQLAAQATKKVSSLMCANKKLEVRKNVLEQKLKEADASRKRIEAILTKQESKGTKKPQPKDLEKIQEFLSAEIECKFRRDDIRQHVEELKKDRAGLSAELHRQEKDLELISMQPPNKKRMSENEDPSDSVDTRTNELKESITFLENSIDVRSDQIDTLMKQVFLFDEDEQKRSWKSFFQCPKDLERGMHFLFKVAVREKHTISQLTEEKQELRQEFQSVKDLNNRMEREIKDVKNHHEKERQEDKMKSLLTLSTLEREHRSEVLELLCGASSISMCSAQELSDSKLLDHIQKQAKQISSLNDIQEELKKKAEECDKLQTEIKRIKESYHRSERKSFFADVSLMEGPIVKSKAKPKKKTVRSVPEEIEEECIPEEDDDKNDPDWERTPLHQRSRRRVSRIKLPLADETSVKERSLKLRNRRDTSKKENLFDFPCD